QPVSYWLYLILFIVLCSFTFLIFLIFFSFFFFNDTATTEIYTLSLHDALPISTQAQTTWTAPLEEGSVALTAVADDGRGGMASEDRKSTRLNSSHDQISYAVFCLKKKKKKKK